MGGTCKLKSSYYWQRSLKQLYWYINLYCQAGKNSTHAKPAEMSGIFFQTALTLKGNYHHHRHNFIVTQENQV